MISSYKVTNSTETLDDFDESIDISSLPIHFYDGFLVEVATSTALQ